MKILYVCSDPSIRPGGRGGGFTTHVEEMIESFRKLGNEVVVVDTKGEARDGSRAARPASDGLEKETPRAHTTCGGSQETGRGEARPHGARWSSAGRVPRVLRVALRDLFYCLHNARFYFRVSAVLKNTRDIDFVYERYYVYQFATSLAVRKRGVPFILELNATTDEFKLTDGLGLGSLAGLVERALTRRADAVITVSGVLKDHLVRRGVPPEKIHVMHNGANLSKFRPDTPGDAIRQKFGLSREDVVAGFVGGFSVWHGAHLLLDVAPLAVKEDRRIRFLMVGGREGSPRFELFRRSVRERGLTEIFRFAGEVPRERVSEHIAAMDIAIISWATDYGSPTKTFEYMAMAKALVAPRVAALEEVLTHERTALLVAAADVHDMARAIVRLASDRGLRENLGTNARRAVEDKYNWDRNATATLEIAKGIRGEAKDAGGEVRTARERGRRGMA